MTKQDNRALAPTTGAMIRAYGSAFNALITLTGPGLDGRPWHKETEIERGERSARETLIEDLEIEASFEKVGG